MTLERLGEMFEGDSGDMCAGKFPLTSMGDERTAKRAQTVSEEPHRRERKFSISCSCSQSIPRIATCQVWLSF